MSKMAAFNAGSYQHQSSTTGPQTRVPISAFLENNGFVPSRLSRRRGSDNEQRSGTVAPLYAPGKRDSPVSPVSLGSAPEADMTGAGNAFATANGPSSFNRRDGSTPVNGYSPEKRQFNTPAHHRRSLSLFRNQGTLSAPITKIKVPDTPTSFVKANMTPEPMLPTIEGYDSSSNDGERLSMARTEVGHPRSVVRESDQSLRDLDLRNVPAGMGFEQNRVAELDRRLGHLEAVVHAMRNTSIPTAVGRIDQLEAIVEDLGKKVGLGTDEEVAKMREVMGSMREALERVGGFF